MCPQNIVNVKRRFVYEQEVYEIVDKKKEAKLMLALFNDIVIICEIKVIKKKNACNLFILSISLLLYV